MTHPSVRRESFLSADVLCFLACLGLSILIAGGVMGWLNQRAGLGALRATERATAFASWYCKRYERVSCVSRLLDMKPADTLALSDSAALGAKSWRFRFQLSTGRKLTVQVDPVGRIHVETPAIP